MSSDYLTLLADLTAWAERTSSHYVVPPDVLVRARAALAEPVPEGRPAPALAEPEISAEEAAMIAAPWSYLDPPPASEGEVAELVAFLRRHGHAQEVADTHWALPMLRIADLLEQRQAAPVPVAWMYKGEPDFDGEKWRENWLVTLDQRLAKHGAKPDKPIPLFHTQIASSPVPVSERLPSASHVYYEFVVSDADSCTQAGGIAPTYAQALSEGQHYLDQYQQDGPHTLELRRVEVLHPDALPEQRYPAPVPVSERLPGPEDCDAEGRVWLYRPQTPILNPYWDLAKLDYIDPVPPTHWLPATSLPLPAAEVQP